MATIKDVAKRAGVSHGTVSNVINGTKTVNSEIIKRVEKAIVELQYQPNDRARSLRSSKSNIVGIILPNITDSIYSYIYTGIQNRLSADNWNIMLYITNDKASVEKLALNKLHQQRSELIVLVSCIPNDEDFFEDLTANEMKLLFLRRRPSQNIKCCFLELDEKSLIHRSVKKAIEKGYSSFLLLADKKIYSNEVLAADGFKLALEEANIKITNSAIYHSQLGEDAIFRLCVTSLMKAHPPQIIFTTNSSFAKIAKAATNLFCGKLLSPPLVAGISNDNWSERYSHYENSDILYDFEHLGYFTGQKVFEILSNKNESYFHSIMLPVKTNSPKPSPTFQISKLNKQHSLNIIVLEGIAADAIKDLTIKFKNTTNIDIYIHSYSYDELNSAMFNKSSSFADFDIIQINNPWLNICAKNNCLEDLSNEFDINSLDYSKEILDYYSLYENRPYALPYMLGSQILFYKKNFFENFRLKRLFYEKHNKELILPQTWADYDTLSEFFTKKFNPLSPVEFGSAFGGKLSSYFLTPRLWEKKVNFFNSKGKFVFSPQEAIPILNDLRNSLKFCDNKAVNWGWKNQAECFLNGAAAMMISYQSHFIEEHNYTTALIMEDIGIANIPSTNFIRGGWSLAINSQSKNKTNAIEFLKWLYLKENIILYNLLGGSNPAKTVLKSEEMHKKFPWFTFAEKCLKNSIPMLGNSPSIQQFTFENLIDPILNEFLIYNLTAEETAIRIYDTIISNI